MLLRSIQTQCSILFNRKSVMFTYFVLQCAVIVNFFMNIRENVRMQYVTEMYNPIKVLTLSDWSITSYYILSFLPILIAIPTALSYLPDRDSRIRVYMEGRCGSADYWYGKVIAVFLVTLFVFTVPFLTELIMCGICYSPVSNNDPSNVSYVAMIGDEGGFFLTEFFFKNQYAYAVLCILLFGIVMGILGVFNFAVSTLPFMKFRIFAFFPVYVLLYGIDIVTKAVEPEYTTYYLFILRMFDFQQKNYMVYLCFLILLLGVSLFIVWRNTRKDNLL